jgi:hypothetical protein
MTTPTPSADPDRAIAISVREINPTQKAYTFNIPDCSGLQNLCDPNCPSSRRPRRFPDAPAIAAGSFERSFRAIISRCGSSQQLAVNPLLSESLEHGGESWRIIERKCDQIYCSH